VPSPAAGRRRATIRHRSDFLIGAALYGLASITVASAPAVARYRQWAICWRECKLTLNHDGLYSSLDIVDAEVRAIQKGEVDAPGALPKLKAHTFIGAGVAEPGVSSAKAGKRC
jgi:hypothetical protein